ncbi:MAG TPA: pseudouridine-5'-phosphate glycosidase [Chloroflexi bacterium]|nr:pseudouridine-5'-phosphate glycosidase [Chloroflexota bacterium]
MKMNYHPEVESALKENKPIVALESTLITHGFPSPKNLLVAKEIEDAVRQEGAVPATIAILDGQITVGLNEEELSRLATSDARKCSARDLPLVIAQKGNGGTTVAATMVIARQAGIPVFATGGIGGVHRGSNFDISADLMELGRTPITVVCAGMKAFLDLPAGLEVLETQAVSVVGYQTDAFPAFYSRESGLPVDLRVDTPPQVANIIRARDALQLSNAILLTVPVPKAKEWPAAQAHPVIEQALGEAEEKGMPGKEITPFILAKIAELSGGQSMGANIALLLNNARVAAQVAIALIEG